MAGKGAPMVRSIALRISAALAVALTATAVLLGTGTAATAGQGDPILAGIPGQHETGTTQLYQDGNVSGLDVTANTGGRAIGGFSSGGSGLYGNGTYGVWGDGTGDGVFGTGPTGVLGEGGAYGVYGNGDTGVYGYGSDGNGVFGETAIPTTSGVYGQNDTTGFGVAGRSNDGTGVLADSINGTALQVTGKAVFSRSGKATVKAGATTVVVKNVALTTDSLVLATLQQVEAGIYVAGVVPSAANSKFTIYLNQAPTGALKVAWFIVN
jgi:hypothetical protein